MLHWIGTIAAAAQELGLNISTARNWAGRVNPIAGKPQAARTVKAAPPQRYAAAVIEEFLGLLRDVGSVSLAARELGLKQSTCFNWARAAAVVSIRARRPSMKQINYLRLRKEGASRRDAAAAVGASKQSSYQWDRQQGASDTAAVGGDAQSLPYKQEVRTTFAEPPAPAAAAELAAAPAAPAPAPAPLDALERPVSDRYLSLPERERIADLLARAESMRAIARDLGRSPGSISREIGRNSRETARLHQGQAAHTLVPGTDFLLADQGIPR